MDILTDENNKLRKELDDLHKQIASFNKTKEEMASRIKEIDNDLSENSKSTNSHPENNPTFQDTKQQVKKPEHTQHSAIPRTTLYEDLSKLLKDRGKMMTDEEIKEMGNKGPIPYNSLTDDLKFRAAKGSKIDICKIDDSRRFFLKPKGECTVEVKVEGKFVVNYAEEKWALQIVEQLHTELNNKTSPTKLGLFAHPQKNRNPGKQTHQYAPSNTTRP